MTDTTTPTDPQPKDPQELLRMVRPLTDERRIEARKRAADLVIQASGDVPKPEDFANHSISKYPASLIRLVNQMCVGILITAFLPSAFRLFKIGSETFAATFQDAHAAMVTGASIVIMSELSMILFSIASVVIEGHKNPIETDTKAGWGTKALQYVARIDSVKILLGISQILAIAIALVGNAQVSLVGEHAHNLFAVIEAFAPSVFVFATAYVLKAQMLKSIERQHANTVAYQTAMNAWQSATSHPEKDPLYKIHFYNALRDFLKEDNARGNGAKGRIDYMVGLITVDWQRLVKRELMAENWYNDPDAATSVGAMSVQTTDRQTVDSRQHVYAPLSSAPTTDRRQTDGQQVWIQNMSDQTGHQTDGQTYGVYGTSAVYPPSEQTTNDRQIMRSGVGYTREASGVALAAEWLKAHPEHMGTPLRALEPLIGVNKDTISAAKKVIKNQQTQLNGAHE